MEWLRPVVTGLVGGLIAMGVTRVMRRRLPGRYRGRKLARLEAEYSAHLRFCSVVFVGSLVGAVLFYQLGYARSNDWRPLFTAFGGGMVVPTVCMYFWLPRERFAEFWAAAAAKEGFGPRFMSAMFVLCTIALFAGLGGYLRR